MSRPYTKWLLQDLKKREEKTGLTRGCGEVKVTSILRNDPRREREKRRKGRGIKLRVSASAAL